MQLGVSLYLHHQIYRNTTMRARLLYNLKPLHRQLSTSLPMELPPYLFRASDHTADIRTHPLDNSIRRHHLSLSDPCGLTQLGVHLCHLPPNNTSTVVHWHSREDEWFYIIKASDDARLLIHEVDQDNMTKEKEIRSGDFVGFPAGTKIGHAFRSGESELIYLVGGSRKQTDVVHYPVKGRRLVVDRTGAVQSWMVDEKDVKESPIIAKVE